MARKKLDLTNCIVILRACARRPQTAQQLQRSTGLSRATFFRTLIDLREQLHARINWEDGRYSVADWGLLNRSRVGVLPEHRPSNRKQRNRSPHAPRT